MSWLKRVLGRVGNVAKRVVASGTAGLSKVVGVADTIVNGVQAVGSRLMNVPGLGEAIAEVAISNPEVAAGVAGAFGLAKGAVELGKQGVRAGEQLQAFLDRVVPEED